MEFTKDDFVFHSTQGVGRVIDIVLSEGLKPDSANICIDFGPRGRMTYTQYNLEHNCHKISPLGFRAFAFLDRAGANLAIQEKPVDVILMVLQDFPGLRATTDDFKYYLSSYIPDWLPWWKKVQLMLKDDVRIDTSLSKRQEYGIYREVSSRAEEIYLAFNRVRTFDTKQQVYDQARRALIEHLAGQELSSDHLQDVLEFVGVVTISNLYPLSDRIDAVFRLIEGKWIAETVARERLESLLNPDLKLYKLNIYSLNRLVDYLLKNYPVSKRIDLLTTGICSTEDICGQLVDWALKRGESDIIAKFFIESLGEYLPPTLEEEKYQSLVTRWKESSRLVKAISPTDPVWKTILEKYSIALISIGKLSTDKASVFLPWLGELAGLIYQHAILSQKDLEIAFFEEIINPGFPLRFMLDLLDTIRRTKDSQEFYQKLVDHLWESGEKRNYDFLGGIIKGDNLEQAASLIQPAIRIDHPMLRNLIGQKICDLAGQDQRSRLVSYLPMFNQLYGFPGSWNWSGRLEPLREEALLASFEKTKQDQETDLALNSAVRRYADSHIQKLQQDLKTAQDQVTDAGQEILRLETLLREKETRITELRSGFGGDTADARFEERIHILKEVATSLAEFERAATANLEQSRGIDALLKRMFNILAGLKVVPMEPLGTKVVFNVQKHRLVDTVHVDPGETVIIFERGFLIRDFEDNLRLLKTALVKKEEES